MDDRDDFLEWILGTEKGRRDRNLERIWFACTDERNAISDSPVHTSGIIWVPQRDV
jgi:hypothetical protein